jgi:hypothetical protein
MLGILSGLIYIFIIFKIILLHIVVYDAMYNDY